MGIHVSVNAAYLAHVQSCNVLCMYMYNHTCIFMYNRVLHMYMYIQSCI